MISLSFSGGTEPSSGTFLAQAYTVVERLRPMCADLQGNIVLVGSFGWLLDLVTEWTGNATQASAPPPPPPHPRTHHRHTYTCTHTHTRTHAHTHAHTHAVRTAVARALPVDGHTTCERAPHGVHAQPYPIPNRDAPQWSTGNATYADVRDLISALKIAAARCGIPQLKIGSLHVGWTHLYDIGPGKRLRMPAHCLCCGTPGPCWSG